MNSRKLVFAGVVLLVASSALAMPPRSFLKKPAVTHASLISQVKSDPIVLDRYERHFGMSEADVIKYLSGLHLARQPKTALMRVYYVPDEGQLFMSILTVPKNELIWVDANNKAILLQKCGNPVAQGPRSVVSTEFDSESLANFQPKQATELLNETEIFSKVGESTAALAAIAPVGFLSSAVASTVITSTIAPATAGAIAGGGGSVLGWLAAAPIAAVVITSGKGGDKAVPEPASIVVIGFGAAALTARRRK